MPRDLDARPALASHREMLMQPGEYRVMYEVEDVYWWYRGLRALVRELLARYAAPLKPPLTILDAGCGTGANLELLQTYGHAIGIDLSEEAIGFCRTRKVPASRTLLASITELPFPNAFFDLAVSFDVICNIPDDASAFREIARVLKPGGRFIVQLPAYSWLWSTHDVAVGHQRRYSRPGLRESLVQAGFQVERLTHTNTLFLPLAIAERLRRRRITNHDHAVRSDLATPLPAWLNNGLSASVVAEMRLAARVDLPVGLSILGVVRKR